ncbi:glycosyltransferase family 2 protein [Ammoniphilus sp. YIM 78166]|uniref:glycosyltransferase family 2 protein n=1 Tax=Ammoniphilus sp. YIM 78166 TaxID=1644106 RepID=UPI0010706452|nr:glycosyltransferase family 2 protein [Ammoniphilus sp. YIM 78166]
MKVHVHMEIETEPEVMQMANKIKEATGQSIKEIVESLIRQAHPLTTTTTLAIIIPVFNESKAIHHNFSVIHERVRMDGLHCKFLFVDDGSTDDTWNEITKLINDYEQVSAIRFARNFGKEIAISAGLDHIEADRYLVMDSDLQHPPQCIKEMMAMMDQSGVLIVNGMKKERGTETFLYRFLAQGFYKVLKRTTGLNLNNSSDFKLLDHKVVQTLRTFRESNLFFRGLVDWVGFSKTDYFFSVEDRTEGSSRFSFAKLMGLALNAIVSHTSKPLYLTLFGGIAFFIVAFVLGIQTLINYFLGQAVSGFSTVIILILLSGSIINISLGIIGVYISRIYDEVKQRPKYIVSEKIE